MRRVPGPRGPAGAAGESGSAWSYLAVDSDVSPASGRYCVCSLTANRTITLPTPSIGASIAVRIVSGAQYRLTLSGDIGADWGNQTSLVMHGIGASVVMFGDGTQWRFESYSGLTLLALRPELWMPLSGRTTATALIDMGPNGYGGGIRTGTTNRDVTPFRPGIAGTPSFSTTNYISLLNSYAQLASTGACTVAGTLGAPSSFASNAVILSRHANADASANGNYNYALYTNPSGELAWTQQSGTKVTATIATSGLGLATTMQRYPLRVMGTRNADGRTITLYLDGLQVGSGVAAAAASGGSAGIPVLGISDGAHIPAGNGFQLCDVCFYGRELTAREAYADFQLAQQPVVAQ